MAKRKRKPHTFALDPFSRAARTSTLDDYDDPRAFFRQAGARGGTIGSANLTAAERKARARKAGQASAAARKRAKAQATKAKTG